VELHQVAYVEEVLELDKKKIKARRAIEGGYEILECPLPALLTVLDAPDCEPRPPAARRIMKYKKAKTRSELHAAHGGADYTDAEALAGEEENLRRTGLWIHEWGAADIAADPERIGLKGSPTKVKQIESVVLKGGSFKRVEPTDSGIAALMHELIADHTLG
jgi:electron transfer flavoprotein beta subunit